MKVRAGECTDVGRGYLVRARSSPNGNVAASLTIFWILIDVIEPVSRYDLQLLSALYRPPPVALSLIDSSCDLTYRRVSKRATHPNIYCVNTYVHTTFIVSRFHFLIDINLLFDNIA